MKEAWMKFTSSRVTYRLMGTKLLKRMRKVNHCPASLEESESSQLSLKGVPNKRRVCHGVEVAETAAIFANNSAFF